MKCHAVLISLLPIGALKIERCFRSFCTFIVLVRTFFLFRCPGACFLSGIAGLFIVVFSITNLFWSRFLFAVPRPFFQAPSVLVLLYVLWSYMSILNLVFSQFRILYLYKSFYFFIYVPYQGWKTVIFLLFLSFLSLVLLNLLIWNKLNRFALLPTHNLLVCFYLLSIQSCLL